MLSLGYYFIHMHTQYFCASSETLVRNIVLQNTPARMQSKIQWSAVCLVFMTRIIAELILISNKLDQVKRKMTIEDKSKMTISCDLI